MTENIEQSAVASTFWKKMIALALIAAVVALLYWQFGHYLQLGYLAKQEAQLKTFQAESPLLVFGVAFLIYVAVTGLSLPGATLLTLVFAWYFGFWHAVVLVSFASTTGATIAFLLSRYFFRNAVKRKFGGRLQTFNEAVRREGAFYLFTLRLIPAVPFFAINAVMGLTEIRTRTFWWVSQLGMLPGTVVYVYAGSRVPDLQTLSDKGVKAVFTPSQLTQIMVAFVLLGLFPLATRWVLKWLRPATAPLDSPADPNND